MSTEPASDPFPCKLTIRIPFPTARLAHAAQRALRVDAELSTLVTRSFSLARADETDDTAGNDAVLVVAYAATTNRMLRVAVNGFFESLGVVLHCMQELDVDVVEGPVTQSLVGVQGLVDVGEEGVVGEPVA